VFDNENARRECKVGDKGRTARKGVNKRNSMNGARAKAFLRIHTRKERLAFVVTYIFNVAL